MRRLRRSLRGFGVLWAVLQIALPGGLAVLDGMASLRDRADVVAHVEATSGKTCQPPHSTECGLCRYLSTGGVAQSGVGMLAWPSPVRGASPDAELSAPPCRIATTLHSRAPPLV